MSRIACVWIPDLPLAAHLRLDPDAATLPLALTDERRVVIARTTAAAGTGVVCGMTATQARAVCDGVVIRPSAEHERMAALGTVAEVAATLSARVEIASETVFLDCYGTAVLCPSEPELAGMLGARVAQQGLPAWIGIADGKVGAAVAARESRGVRIVARGGTRAFLAPLPLTRLDPEPELAAILASWGLRCIGDLAALPTGAVAHRLGPAGATLHHRARGEDDARLVCRPTPVTLTERIVLDYGLDRREPLLFMLRRLLECLTRRLDLQGLGCRELQLDLAFDGGGRDLRTLVTAAPTIELKTLLTLARVDLEHRPPVRPVTAISIQVEPARLRPVQLDLLRPRGPAPTTLAALLARLAALCGPDRVGILQPSESHRPDGVRVTPFGSNATPNRWKADGDPAPGRGPADTAIRLTVRAFRPAVPLEVFESRERLDYVRGGGFGGRVVQAAGPWRVRGEWWTAEPYAREYFDVALSDGGIYRIYHDARTRQWWADGVYD